ncbi:hypothetical protein P8S54_03585 [Thiomicrospira sp. R3]|uniref:hypothetical protein n=1 Tax=Thiomicrospira sp. R3 TaxID=3035472 RepID=UPI00259B3A82|nr:hypothetical protein [Thiomicrospira sp. R3]WFE69391.1 hypothetical protein P8S54_03585 [Thiomicrospira sp. R3]
MNKKLQTVIAASKHWTSDQQHITEFERYEGELSHKSFAKRLQKVYANFAKQFDQISQKWVVGFEIEFYLAPEQISLFAQSIDQLLPRDQVLLVSLDQVAKTDGQNFYLIAEKTGCPPAGLQSYELVSPKLDPLSSIYYLRAFAQKLKQFDAKDGDDIGFHLHFSTEGCGRISPLSVVYCLDQQRLLGFKSRKFTRDIVSQLFDYQPEDWAFIFKRVLKKNYSINFLDFDNNNHFELRALGGKGYLFDVKHNPANYALQSLMALTLALSLSDKKLAKLISRTYSLDKTLINLNQVEYSKLKAMPKNTIWTACF